MNSQYSKYFFSFKSEKNKGIELQDLNTFFKKIFLLVNEIKLSTNQLIDNN